MSIYRERHDYVYSLPSRKEQSHFRQVGELAGRQLQHGALSRNALSKPPKKVTMVTLPLHRFRAHIVTIKLTAQY